MISHHIYQLTGKQLRPGARSESFIFTAPKVGRYRFKGGAALLVAHGVIEQGATSAKSLNIQIK